MVVEAKGEWAHVVTEKRDACGGCSAQHSCRTCLSASKIITRVRNPIGAKAGDLVVISLRSRVLWQGAALMYLIPVAGLMFGAGAGLWLNRYVPLGETLPSLILSLVGLSLGFLILRFISNKAAVARHFVPAISRILHITPMANQHEYNTAPCSYCSLSSD